MKKAMVEGSILGITDITKPFVVETDTLDFALEGVFLQDGHPIAYKSRKLNVVERRYATSKKEMLDVVDCLRA